jgi:predicted nucleic acid-binding protein
VIVVDTNILAYRLLPGTASESVDGLLAAEPEWAAPLLWRSEFRNVLAGLIRSGKVTAADSEVILRRAQLCLTGGEHVVSDEAVLRLVALSRCSAYDCEFVALAQALQTQLVTADRLLLTSFPATCRRLEDFSH